jgi:hypothetical protein
MFTYILLPFALGTGAIATAIGRAAACDSYVVNGTVGAFATHVKADFSGVAAGANVNTILRFNCPIFLKTFANINNFSSQYGLYVSNYAVNDVGTPNTHVFTPANVAFGAGTLNLKVSALTGGGAVKSAEIGTVDQFTYGSVRVVYQASSTPGVCEGRL